MPPIGLAFFLLALAATASSLVYNRDTHFVNRAVLAQPDTYTLFWNFTQTDIVFKVVAKTSGWLGFGLSPNGGMQNSDLVLAWTDKTGQARFQDSHVDETTEVKADVTENWKRLFYANKDGETTVIFRRALNVCGPNYYGEINIGVGMSNFVIFAWGRDATPKYHMANRGARSLPLTATLNQEVQMDMDSVEVLEFDIKVTSGCAELNASCEKLEWFKRLKNLI